MQSTANTSALAFSILLVSGALSLSGCRTQEDRAMPADYPDSIELLGFEGCPNTPRLRESLREALRLGGWREAFADTDQEVLPPGDPRRRYPAPTILVGGSDLFGAAPDASDELGCRIYSGGPPDAKVLEAALRRRVTR